MMLKHDWSKKLSNVVCLSSCRQQSPRDSDACPRRFYYCRLGVVALGSHLIITSIVDPHILDI
jgi:hypothetical protein